MQHAPNNSITLKQTSRLSAKCLLSLLKGGQYVVIFLLAYPSGCMVIEVSNHTEDYHPVT